MIPVTDRAAEYWYQRYRTVPDRLSDTWNDTLSTLLSHRSVRDYRSTPLPEGTLEHLVAAAQSASSSSNLQTWSVVAVEDPARKAALAEAANHQAHILQAPVLLVWIADLARMARIAEQENLPYEGLDYLEMFLTASIDAALAAQNAVVAAESLGLGVVYIGALRNRPEVVAELLGLPPRTFAVFGLCVGYPDASVATGVKPRLPQAAVLHRERYQLDQDSAIATYNEVVKDFYTEQKMDISGNWSEHSAKRVAVSSLSGRDRLREILNRLGFPLY